MKILCSISPISPRWKNFFAGTALMAASATWATAQTDGTWNFEGGGNWSDVTKWVDSEIADGLGATALFTPTASLTADAIVVLDSSGTLTNLTFQRGPGAATTSPRWTLNTANDAILTLDGDNPGLFTNGRINATINAPIVFGGNGTGSAVIHAENTVSGDNPSMTINSSITLQNRDLLLRGSFDTDTINGNITGTGNVTVNRDNNNRTLFLLGANNDFSGSFTVANNNTVVELLSLPDNVVLNMTGGQLMLRNGADIRVSSINGSGFIRDQAGGNNTSHLRLNVQNGLVEQVDARMGDQLSQSQSQLLQRGRRRRRIEQ